MTHGPTREMQENDLVSVASLSGELGYPTTPATLAPRFAALRKVDEGLFVVEADGQIAGWAHVGGRVLLESPPHAEVGALVVGRAFRRRGVGRALVERAIEWTRAHGLPTLRLRSNIARPEAHAFYPALGFQLLKTQHAYELRV